MTSESTSTPAIPDSKTPNDDAVILNPDEPTDGDNTSADEADTCKDESHKEEGVVVCPECQCKKRPRTGGYPFGRKPADPDAPKKPKEDPKTAWGKFQRQYCEKYKELPSATACALARIYYVPVHADGTKAPKSLERLLRETHGFIAPRTKTMEDDARTAALRSWVEDLMRHAILDKFSDPMSVDAGSAKAI